TRAYADAVIANFGKKPSRLEARVSTPLKMPAFSKSPVRIRPKTRRTLGCDIFVEADTDSETLGKFLETNAHLGGLKLKMISNRGTQVYPAKGAETDCVDQWRCRFLATDGSLPGPARLAAFLQAIEDAGWRWMHIEKLEEFDGNPGFTKAQGED
ncbi:MAG: isocitrate dehydrogenase, partial [Verrucomicrobiia bacterium]